MKKSLRFISLLIAAVFLISGSLMIICHADEQPAEGGGSGVSGDGGSGGGSGDGGSGGGSGDSGSGGGSGDSGSGGSGGGVSDGGSGGSGGSDSGSGGGSGDSGSGGSGYSYDSGYVSGYDSGYDAGYESGYYAQVEEADPIYYGDASQYSYNISADSSEAAAGSVSSSLYNSSGMSAAEAAPNEWSDITLDEKTIQTGVTDFSAIKENTEVEDNGYWILYVGYALLALSVLGILYFIIATIAHRSSVRTAERLEQRRRSSYSSRSAADRMEERDRREAGAYRRTSRFADEDSGRSRRASSRYDTGEVYVPRRAAKR